MRIRIARIAARIRKIFTFKGLRSEFLLWDGIVTENVADPDPEELHYVASILGPTTSAAYELQSGQPGTTITSLRFPNGTVARPLALSRQARARLLRLYRDGGDSAYAAAMARWFHKRP